MEDYEEVCPRCDGFGLMLQVSKNENKPNEYYVVCNLCEGSGVIDWITKIKNGKE